jgi:hypothetical protein
MALQFLSKTDAGDAELVIAFDLNGLAALLKGVEAALATGQGHLTPEPDEPLHTFGSVTVKFIDPGRDRRPGGPPDDPQEVRGSDPVLSG